MALKVLNHSMRIFISFVFLIANLAQAENDAPKSSATSERPNILLIYVDDLGYGDLPSYGHPTIKTPNLDRLAAEGIRATAYYAPSALCSPSRAGLLTGRHPVRTGIINHIPKESGTYLPRSEITIASLLKDAGYRTALIGKYHLNSLMGTSQEPQPMDHGFEYFFGNEGGFHTYTNKNPVNLYRQNEKLPPQEGYIAEIYANEAIDFIENSLSEQKPFFLMLSMVEPHTPIENPPAFNQLYSQFTDGEIIPIPSGRPEGIPIDKIKARGPGEYYANISYMDAQIGSVLNYLEAQKIEENTFIVFASDNGPVTSNWFFWWEVNAYGETAGFRGRKHLLYEGGIRVPAIFKWSGQIPKGVETDQVINGLDLFSTFASVAEVSIPQDREIDGRDISDLLFKQEQITPKAHFWHLHSKNGLDYAIQLDGWKLLLDRDRKPVALYDLTTDPHEMLNRLKDRPASDDRLKARPDMAEKLMLSFKNDFLPLLSEKQDDAAPSFSN